MKATVWRGGTYGIRVGRANARRYFQRDWNSIVLEIDGIEHTFPLTATFWTTCPEFRGKAIAQWLQQQGLVPWLKGHPPEVVLEPLGDNRFRLSS